MAGDASPTSAQVDFAGEGLLDGLEGEAHAGRLALLEELHGDGVGLGALREAVDEDRLALLGVELALGGTPRFTLEEIARQAGVDVGALAASRHAFGLPEPSHGERVATDDDLAAARRLRQVIDAGLPQEPLLDVARVMGRAMAQVAAAMRQVVGEAFLEPGLTEHELSHRYTAATEALIPTLAPTLTHVFSLHLRELLRTDAIGAAQLATGSLAGAQETCVAFADLVGFTRLGGSVGADELGRVARRLEQLAAAHVRSPVRIVKSIGDAVLLASRRPEPLLDACLALVAAADEEGEDFPQLRCGLAFGEVLERDGDVYGHTVNVASRVSATAKPGSVLGTEEVHDAGGERYAWSFAGARRLKGVAGECKLWRARRLEV